MFWICPVFTFEACNHRYICTATALDESHAIVCELFGNRLLSVGRLLCHCRDRRVAYDVIEVLPIWARFHPTRMLNNVRAWLDEFPNGPCLAIFVEPPYLHRRCSDAIVISRVQFHRLNDRFRIQRIAENGMCGACNERKHGIATTSGVVDLHFRFPSRRLKISIVARLFNGFRKPCSAISLWVFGGICRVVDLKAPHSRRSFPRAQPLGPLHAQNVESTLNDGIYFVLPFITTATSENHLVEGTPLVNRRQADDLTAARNGRACGFHRCPKLLLKRRLV